MTNFPPAILFDMDDTLLTDGVNAERCWQICFERLADRITPLVPATLIGAIKEYARWFWSDVERHRQGRLELEATRRAIVAEALLRLEINDDDLVDTVAATFSQLREEAIAFCEGAHEVLCHLKERGVRLALLTNGNATMQRRKITRFGLEPFFDCILVEGEFGIGKPNERVYRHALELLAATPAGTWMVGDNLEWDVAAPQRLGITGIWVDHLGVGLPESSVVRPDRIIRTLPELLNT